MSFYTELSNDFKLKISNSTIEKKKNNLKAYNIKNYVVTEFVI
jgi:hypothetical protein